MDEGSRAERATGATSRSSKLIHGASLHTICEEARCPNIAECWGRGTATFQILGETCTRACRYCYVHSGTPERCRPARAAAARADRGGDGAPARRRHLGRPRRPPRPRAPRTTRPRSARSRRSCRKRPSRCSRRTSSASRRRRSRSCSTRGPTSSTTTSRPSAGCTAACAARRRATTRRSGCSRRAKEVADYDVMTKCGIIVGLGETNDEVVETLRDLRGNGVDVVTIGQYLQPSAKHATIDRWVHPDEFRWFREQGEALGFGSVFSGPLVRSSYRADEQRHAARPAAARSPTSQLADAAEALEPGGDVPRARASTACRRSRRGTQSRWRSSTGITSTSFDGLGAVPTIVRSRRCAPSCAARRPCRSERACRSSWAGPRPT